MPAAERPGPRIACDLPIEREGIFVHNELLLTGWALSPVGIAGVIVQVDDRTLHASYGLDTPWLAESLPDAEGAGRAGYRLQVDTSRWSEGPRRVVVAAYDQDGGRAEVAGTVEIVPFDRPRYTREENLAAMAEGEVTMWLERPLPVAETPELEAPAEIAGWAYAAGGLDSVRVTVDGRTRHDALHPIFRPDLVDDYGEEVAMRSGFLLRLHPRDCPPGWHRLSVVATATGRRAVGMELDFHCLPEPETPAAPSPGEPVAVDWMAEPPRRRPGQDDLRAIARDLRCRRVLPLAAGRDVLVVGEHPDATALEDAGARSVIRVEVPELAEPPGDDGVVDLAICFDVPAPGHLPVAALDELRRVLRTDAVLVAVGSAGLEAELRTRFANVRAERGMLAGQVDCLTLVAGDGELPELDPIPEQVPFDVIARLSGAIATWQDRALLAEADAAASRNQANIARMHQEATLGMRRETEHQLAAARHSLSETHAELERAHGDLSRAEDELAAARELAARQADELRAAAERATNAEAAVAAQTGSVSWRVTRPLRTAKRAARRILRRT